MEKAIFPESSCAWVTCQVPSQDALASTASSGAPNSTTCLPSGS